MPPQGSPQKRRRGSSGASRFRHGHSRTMSRSRILSNMRSGSRYSVAFRRSSTDYNSARILQKSPRQANSSRATSSAGEDPGLQDTRSETVTEPPRNDFDNDIDDLQDEVIMAVHVTDRGSVGCAYYLARDEKMYFMEDVQLGGRDIVENLKLFIDPTVILVSTKCTDEAINSLDPELRNGSGASVDGRSDQTRLPYLLECRPMADFGYESARDKLVNLRLGQQNGPTITYVVPGDVVINAADNGAQEAGSFAGRQAQFLRLAGWINTESRLTVGCAGAVLSYLQRRRSSRYLPGNRDVEGMFRVGTIEMFSLKKFVFINADTLASLQITTTEFHPNAQQAGSTNSNRRGGSKEGLSVYGLFQPLAKTVHGRLLLRQYFLRPSQNIEVIEERLQTISVLLNADNASVLDRLTCELSNAQNMRAVIINLRKGISNGPKSCGVSTSIWCRLRQFLFSALQIADMLSEIRGTEGIAIFTKISERFDRHRFAAIGQQITDVIDLDESKAQRHVVIREGISQELDEAKRTYGGIEDMLSQVAVHIARQVPAELEHKVNVIFFPQIGFLISLTLEDDMGAAAYTGSPVDPWEKMFTSQTCAYYKNANMTELDERFGDIYGRMLDMEIEIVQELAQNVLEYEGLLNLTSDICGEMDSLVALAHGANKYNLVRPQMSHDNIIKIKSGRHILQELTVPTFVPNDTYMVGGPGVPEAHGQMQSPTGTPRRLPPVGPNMVLLTGPNYSGKSVYLKQVALIVYMAHVGCFVPAEAAKIGLTDKILTRIATRESVSRIQSAFMIDLQQASMALNFATNRSLIIVDEFGKGTESSDGAGLAAGVFEHLLQRGPNCPKVLGATHFHEIFEHGFLRPRESLAFGHLDVRVDAVAANFENQITYLYTYRQGRSTSSFGTICARMNGVGEDVVNRAEELLLLAARGEDLVEACSKLPDAELAELDEAVWKLTEVLIGPQVLTTGQENIARDFLSVDDFSGPRSILAQLLTATVPSHGSVN